MSIVYVKMHSEKDGLIDAQIMWLRKYSKLLVIIEFQWWMYGYSLDIFNFSVGLKNVHNKMLEKKGFKYLCGGNEKNNSFLNLQAVFTKEFLFPICIINQHMYRR